MNGKIKFKFNLLKYLTFNDLNKNDKFNKSNSKGNENAKFQSFQMISFTSQ